VGPVSRRGLQVTLTVVGSVATVFGAQGVLAGVEGVRNGGGASANVDSELRFFSAWYAVSGVSMLRAARSVESDGVTIRLICLGWLIAACGRVLSVRKVGKPDRLFRVLTGVEFAIPAVIAPWQAVVARSASRPS
jgi:uncharacterized protein DUF4345